MFITQVPIEYINIIWPAISNYVDSATKYSRGRTDEGSVKEDCLKGNTILWIAHNEDHETFGFVTCQIITYPKIKSLDVQFTGGKKMTEWKSEMMNALEMFSKRNNCSKIQAIGRLGWAHFAEKYGFELNYYIYEKDI
jgi:hypothetical protein